MISSKKIFHANNLEVFDTRFKSTYPYIVRKTQDNGIRGYIKESEEFLNRGNTLSFAQDTFTVFYQKERYFTGNKVKVLKPKMKKFNQEIATFIVAIFHFTLRNFTWGTGSNVNMINSINIQLPTKNGEIDFEFMESFVAELEAQRVAELEAQRVAELEAYLLATGLKDYELTDKEKQAIDKIDKIQWKEFNIIDVFNVKNTKNILSNQIEFNSGNTPYLCASAENNGVASYITFNDLYIDKGNCVFIGGKTFTVSYQKEDFYSNDSHNLVLYSICEDMITEKNQLYMATCIKKGLGHKYSWGNSISNRKIQTDTIMLPIHDKHIDYEYMETLISAVQKLVIKDVVLYAGRKIEATRQVIER